jgi:Diguanylate cyclase, GGDEF domain
MNASSEKPLPAGDAILRRLRIFRIVYGVGTTVLIVLAGDFVYPRLDLAIGRVGSDIIEAVVVALVLFILTAPLTRELTRSILALDSVRQQLYVESIRDPLTGVFNRRHFDERLAEEFERSRRHQLPLSLIAIDVDHFKRINDEFGHLAGDAAVIGVARSLARHRITDIFARICAPQPPRSSSCFRKRSWRGSVRRLSLSTSAPVFR